MDIGLKIQTELSQKGEEIFKKISDKLEKLEEKDKLFYEMSNGILLAVTEERITIVLLLRLAKSDQKEERHSVGIIRNPFESRIIAKEALCNYLVNNSKCSFEMGDDVKDDIEHRSPRYHVSLIKYWW